MEIKSANGQDRRFTQILKGHTPQVAKLAESLRELVQTAVPDIQEQVKNGYAVYGIKEVVLAITVHQNHVNLQFYYANGLSDPEGLLEGKGKRLWHVTIGQPEDLRSGYLSRLVREAVEHSP